jgi:hypothetical protein
MTFLAESLVGNYLPCCYGIISVDELSDALWIGEQGVEANLRNKMALTLQLHLYLSKYVGNYVTVREVCSLRFLLFKMIALISING